MRIPKITSLFMMLTFLTTASLSPSGELEVPRKHRLAFACYELQPALCRQ